MFVKINGTIHYLWRAVDQHGTVLDILVQSRRNRLSATQWRTEIAERFMVWRGVTALDAAV